MRLIRLLKYDLAREAATWASDGVISTSQAEAICFRYGVDYHNLSRRSLGYHVLVAPASPGSWSPKTARRP